MRVDRTWTISFEDHEQQALTTELRKIALSTNIGWVPILPQIARQRQTTLPFRALERLGRELDIVRSRALELMPKLEYNKRFPQIVHLTAEVEMILHSSTRKSA